MDSQPSQPEFEAPPPRRKATAGPWIALILVAVLAGAAWFLFFAEGAPYPWRSLLGQREVIAVADAGPSLPDAGPPVPDVSLSGSDPTAQASLTPLSMDPAWSSWLGAGDLIRRFVGAAARIAEGESPRPFFPFLAPSGEFEVQQRDKRLYIDPKSYARYDTVARVIGSIDAAAVAQAYRQLRPLVQAGYREIAPPSADFDKTLAAAVNRLLAVPVPPGDVEVIESGALYAFADPALEKQSAAAKHLLRMGPANMAHLQTKLRELALALELPITSR